MKYREVNLLGGFYKDASLPWSSQDTVNWLPVPAQSEGTRSPMKLRGLPGLKSFNQSVIPLPQWTTWDPANIVGSGSLEDGNRTFFGTGGTFETAPNFATTGYKRARGKDPITQTCKYYFEVYSNLDTLTFSEWPPVLEQFAIRVGLARRDFTLGQGNTTVDTTFGEVIWKFDAALGGDAGRGQLVTAGVSGMLAGPINVNTSEWVGIAVDATVGPTSQNIKIWCVIDGNWAYEGESPATTPAGSDALSADINTDDIFGGIVPMCSLYNPRSVNPEFVARANFGQEAFRIGDAAFAPGGVLQGFTKGWPAA